LKNLNIFATELPILTKFGSDESGPSRHGQPTNFTNLKIQDGGCRHFKNLNILATDCRILKIFAMLMRTTLWTPLADKIL